MTRTLMSVFGSMSALVLVCLLGGCTDDFNSPCDFPQSPEVARYCGTSQDELGNQSYATCVDPFNPDCQSQLCVIYQGSDSFCSVRCNTNSDCPDSAWCETPTGSSSGVCIPSELR
ncbi:MAG: hypothetical protein JW797_06820 [Bradymonadales bacterium]|nr:hypothetical protein [Bradymonadales bacterium]